MWYRQHARWQSLAVLIWFAKSIVAPHGFHGAFFLRQLSYGRAPTAGRQTPRLAGQGLITKGLARMAGDEGRAAFCAQPDDRIIDWYESCHKTLLKASGAGLAPRSGREGLGGERKGEKRRAEQAARHLSWGCDGGLKPSPPTEATQQGKRTVSKCVRRYVDDDASIAPR